MKHLFLFLTFVCLVSVNLKSQHYPAQKVFTLGAGWHTGGFIDKGYNSILNLQNLKTAELLIPTIGFDLGLTGNFSVGIVATQYSVKSEFSGYTPKNGSPVTQNGQMTMKNTDIGLRILEHPYSDNENLDFCWGAKVGYSFREFTSTVDHGFSSTELSKSMKGIINFQGILAMRAYISQGIGFGAEAALGKTYTFMGGLLIRLGY